MSMSPPDFVIARGATIGFAIAITAACVLWLSGNPAPIWEKVVVGGLAAILTYAGCPLAFNWVNTKQHNRPSYVGTLVPEGGRTLLSDGRALSDIRMEIGISGIVFDNSWGLKDFENTWGRDQFTIETINNHLMVSTKIRDRTGKLIAELQRNEWKVALPPETWDRNYNDNSLEVKDANGNVVLQIRLLKNIVQIQGAWWISFQGRQTQVVVRKTPTSEIHGGYRAQIVFVGIRGDWPEIKPIFVYPSETHLHELRK